jgi:hypothetical protein
MQGSDGDVIEEELQALYACYPDVNGVTVQKLTTNGDVHVIRVPISPRYVDDHESFVKMTLELRVLPDYPSTAVEVVVGEFKGLDGRAENAIETRMREEAMHMKGEMVLGHLIETGFDLMDEYNRPQSTCVFCLEPVTLTVDVVKLPCYHCFHRSCFTAWYVWKQRAIRNRVEELKREHNMNQSMIDKAMEEEGIHASEALPSEYIFPCPCCRVQCNPTSVSMHMDDASLNADDGPIVASPKDGSVSMLPKSVRELVYKEQARFSEILRLQEKHNCLNSCSRS